MKMFFAFALCFSSLFPLVASAQQATFHDPLLDHLAGKWVLRGTILGQPTTHDIGAAWVLEHQYLMFKETSRGKNEKGEPAYMANVYIGWDEPTGQYACVWLDDYGDISTQSIGRAKRDGDVIAFVFKNRDGKGSFHTKFSYDKATDSWSMSMDSDKDGKESPFARTKLSRN